MCKGMPISQELLQAPLLQTRDSQQPLLLLHAVLRGANTNKSQTCERGSHWRPAQHWLSEVQDVPESEQLGVPRWLVASVAA